MECCLDITGLGLMETRAWMWHVTVSSLKWRLPENFRMDCEWTAKSGDKGLCAEWLFRIGGLQRQIGRGFTVGVRTLGLLLVGVYGLGGDWQEKEKNWVVVQSQGENQEWWMGDTGTSVGLFSVLLGNGWREPVRRLRQSREAEPGSRDQWST
eukprot:1026402-Rhodomonas_salina.1